jgi:hypothetical protein
MRALSIRLAYGISLVWFCLTTFALLASTTSSRWDWCPTGKREGRVRWLGRGSAEASFGVTAGTSMRGGGNAMEECTAWSNRSLLDQVQWGGEGGRGAGGWQGGRRNITLPPGIWMWDWRIMSPWLKRIDDELAEFPLSPPPGCELHLTGLGNISQPSRLDGQWDMPPMCSGSVFGVEMCHRTLQFDARELLVLNSGPWLFDRCHLRASGCQVIRSERQTQLSIRRSFVGGYGLDARRAIVFEDNERASNGIVAMDSATGSLKYCRLECTGFLHGSALKVRGKATFELEQCVLANNNLGIHLSAQAQVRAEECVFHSHNNSLFIVDGDHHENEASLALTNCSGEGDVVFYHGIEPRHLVLKDCEFFSKPPQSFDDFFYETYINVPRDPEPLPKGVLPYHLAMQKVCVCACARARV